MNPQAPNIPIPEVPKVEDPERVVNEVKPRVERDNHWISILAMAIFVVLTLGVVAFLYYQNQALKSMLASQSTNQQINQSPTPTATSDPTANWKTYTNQKFSFSFRYPQVLAYINDTTDKFVENGINNSMILVQDFDGLTQAGNKPENFQLMVLVANTKGEFNMENISSPTTSTINGIQVTRGTTTIKMETVPVVVFNTSPNKVAFVLTTANSTQKGIFDQILSTFKFTETGKETCNPNFPVETGTSELTASQDYAIECTSQTTKSDCLSMDVYNAMTKDFSKPDGKPDCSWSVLK